MPLSRSLREAMRQREDDAAAEEFVELLVQVLDVPEVAEAVARAITPYLARRATTGDPRPTPSPVVSGRGQGRRRG